MMPTRPRSRPSRTGRAPGAGPRVRGASAYTTIEVPRLRATGLARACLLCETDSQVLVRCDWDGGHRAALAHTARVCDQRLRSNA
jgi:hypothetical protein